MLPRVYAESGTWDGMKHSGPGRVPPLPPRASRPGRTMSRPWKGLTGALCLETEQDPKLNKRALLWLATPHPRSPCETSQEEIPGCLGLGGCCLQGLGHPGTSFRGW